MENSEGDLLTGTGSEAVLPLLSRYSQPSTFSESQISQSDLHDNSSSDPVKLNLTTDHGERRSKRRQSQHNTQNDSSMRLCVEKNCDKTIPLHQSYTKCQACRRAYRERRMNTVCAGGCGTRIPRSAAFTRCLACRQNSHNRRPSALCGRCGTNILPTGSRFKTCTPCLKRLRERRRQTLAAQVETEVNDAENDDAGISVTTKMHKIVKSNLSSDHDEEEIEEIPCHISEPDNLNTRVETALVQVAQEIQQRMNSTPEQLKDANSRIDDFDDPVDQLEKNEKEKTRIERENERLREELRGLRSQLSSKIRRDLAEHAHLNILNRLLLQTRFEYSHNKRSQSTLIETFDNLSSQLRDLADRRLDYIPIGFGPIMEMISNQNMLDDDDERLSSTAK
ncbi:hypothetical protein F5877DRAFT_85531 [Lentinula edodes]|nr:hypothetical protein F5877DRAFT_85531 [Lentinula edodes]